MLSKSEYVLGHSDCELERLQLQADCLEGLTRRLIRKSGLRPGSASGRYRFGAGDVAMLIAGSSGLAGEIVAGDREERAIEPHGAARRRAGSKRIKFVAGTDEDLRQFAPFDAVIGRCVLVHQHDPVAMVRLVAEAVRPGGIVAFLEPAIHVAMQVAPESAAPGGRRQRHAVHAPRAASS